MCIFYLSLNLQFINNTRSRRWFEQHTVISSTILRATDDWVSVPDNPVCNDTLEPARPVGPTGRVRSFDPGRAAQHRLSARPGLRRYSLPTNSSTADLIQLLHIDVDFVG